MENNNRRQFLKKMAAISAGLIFAPNIFSEVGTIQNFKPMTRKFGKINFNVTTFGLGGQASLQWTPDDVDPVRIIEKAFHLGVNYFDTSNVYGPSQLNFGKAFRNLNLIPDKSGYDKNLRKSIFLTAKSGLRLAKGYKKDPNVKDMSDCGNFSIGCIGDLKRTLSQIFGDGKGYYPKGAYVNMFLVHMVETFEDVEAIFLGLDNPSPELEQIGSLAALVDYRDGTNKTGLNPAKERLIRHIGFSGHRKASVLMQTIQKDVHNVFDAVLIPINPNDVLYRSMQYNVLPIARAKNMGIIAMKVFADGAMYNRKKKGDVIRTVGSSALDYRNLVQYTVSTTGVHTTIVGIGEINDDPVKCQLSSNLKAAQINWGGLTENERKRIELITAKIGNGKTNGFQEQGNHLIPPGNVKVSSSISKKKMSNIITWYTAYAGSAELDFYEIYRNDKLIATIPFTPQITQEPYQYDDPVRKGEVSDYKLAVVDKTGDRAFTESIII